MLRFFVCLQVERIQIASWCFWNSRQRLNKVYDVCPNLSIFRNSSCFPPKLKPSTKNVTQTFVLCKVLTGSINSFHFRDIPMRFYAMDFSSSPYKFTYSNCTLPTVWCKPGSLHSRRKPNNLLYILYFSCCVPLKWISLEV